MKKLSSIIYILVLLICFSSCSDKHSLQNYILTHAEKENFSSSSIPKSILKPITAKMNDVQLEAYEAIGRINVLAFKISDTNTATYLKERKNVKSILKQDKYQELIDVGSRGIVKYAGRDDSIDEIVVFLTDKNFGFVVARIIGDDMNMNKFMELYKLVATRDLSANSIDLGMFSNFLK